MPLHRAAYYCRDEVCLACEVLWLYKTLCCCEKKKKTQSQHEAILVFEYVKLVLCAGVRVTNVWSQLGAWNGAFTYLGCENAIVKGLDNEPQTLVVLA